MEIFPNTPKTLLDELALAESLDEAKWCQFDARYRPVIRFFLLQRFPTLQSECDDLVQETMCRLVAVVREGQYDRARARFRTFISAVVNNIAVDILRRQTRYAAIPLETVEWLHPDSSDHAVFAQLDTQWQEASYAAARWQVLHKMVLPPHYAEVWRALEHGAKPADIANRFGVTATFVRQVKHRVTRLISDQLES